jgi:hypothetical protein
VFGDGDDEESDGDNNNEEPELSSEPSVPEPISGTVFVTSTQVLFVAADAEQSHSDLAIGGACVVLHAMTEDPAPAVYLQLSSSSSSEHADDGGFGGGSITEVTLVPSDGRPGDDGDCQRLFDALCKLISLHPIVVENDEDDDDGYGGGMFGFGSGGMIGGGFGDDAFGDYGEGGESLVWATLDGDNEDDNGGGATDAEREAMLERLDGLLVVAPGLQAGDTETDGQFDDAPEA